MNILKLFSDLGKIEHPDGCDKVFIRLDSKTGHYQIEKHGRVWRFFQQTRVFLAHFGLAQNPYDLKTIIESLTLQHSAQIGEYLDQKELKRGFEWLRSKAVHYDARRNQISNKLQDIITAAFPHIVKEKKMLSAQSAVAAPKKLVIKTNLPGENISKYEKPLLEEKPHQKKKTPPLIKAPRNAEPQENKQPIPEKKPRENKKPLLEEKTHQKKKIPLFEKAPITAQPQETHHPIPEVKPPQDNKPPLEEKTHKEKKASPFKIASFNKAAAPSLGGWDNECLSLFNINAVAYQLTGGQRNIQYGAAVASRQVLKDQELDNAFGATLLLDNFIKGWKENQNHPPILAVALNVGNHWVYLLGIEAESAEKKGQFYIFEPKQGNTKVLTQVKMDLSQTLGAGWEINDPQLLKVQKDKINCGVWVLKMLAITRSLCDANKGQLPIDTLQKEFENLHSCNIEEEREHFKILFEYGADQENVKNLTG